MQRLLLAGLAGAAALATVPPAQAHPNWHYTGGCAYFAISDGTDSPQTYWYGEGYVLAVTTYGNTGTPTPTAPISIDCDLRINGVSAGIVASCSGIGLVACAAQFTFEADPDDIVVVCDLATVGGEFHRRCPDFTSPLIPYPIQQFIDEEVMARVDEAIDVPDSVICPVTQGMDGGPLDNPPAFDVRADGDLYTEVSGVRRQVWDCDAGS